MLGEHTNRGSALRWLRISWGLVLLLGLSGCIDSREDGPGSPIRIVLVTLDTLRLDGFTGSGVREGPMPRTLEFAAQGQRFEQAYAASPNTQPTHASMLTGLHPWEHGVTRNGRVLDDGFETIAELLQTHGYSTAAVVSSFPLHARFGFDQGFDSYQDDFMLEAGNDTWEGVDLETRAF
jgi:arylsulfatase A-like enzyme